jgi:thymidine phosphorylase
MIDELFKNFSVNPIKYADSIISFYSQDNIDPNDILLLAYLLARSGNQLNITGNIPLADIPSTGGPSSLTTLLCPLYLTLLGYKVIKLGVPGRPSGGIDVLAQITGYKTNFTYSEINRLIKCNMYIHFLANKDFTPLDAILFDYRKKTDNLNIPYLSIASLLAKKIVVGLNLVGLDVRVSSFGNLGKSFEEAKKYSRLFIELADKAGIEAKCFLSDSSQPYQPYIGRGEALAALYDIFQGNANPWLIEHDNYCKYIVNQLGKSNFDICFNNSILKKAFENNLSLQGSKYKYFEKYVDRIQNLHCYKIKAPYSGYCYYNLQYIRKLITHLQNLSYHPQIQFPDPSGVILQIKPGLFVQAGSTIATYRIDNNLIKEDFMFESMISIEATQRMNTQSSEVIK